MQAAVYIIKGENFSDFKGFIEECNRSFISSFGGAWNGNLDAFDDYLSWAEGNYELHWLNSSKSKSDLDHSEMEKRLTDVLETCHPSNRKSVKKRIRMAKRSEGQTLFEELIEIIEGHSDQLSIQRR